MGDTRAWPTPGQEGNGLGNIARLDAASIQPDYRPTQALTPSLPAKPLAIQTGRSLAPGQPAFPTGQSGANPWGVGRGGSGAIPIYRRPQTLPGTRA